MKKIIACLLVMVMCLTMFIGCGSKKNTDSQTDATKKVDVKKDQVNKDTKKFLFDSCIGIKKKVYLN